MRLISGILRMFVGYLCGVQQTSVQMPTYGYGGVGYRNEWINTYERNVKSIKFLLI